MLWLDDVSSDGIGDNRAYEDLSGVEWPEVEAVVAEEEALLRSAAEQAADADDFDRLVDRDLEDRYPGDDFDEGPLSPLIALDVGVMSAVAALSASGCVTTTSCRGHRVSGEPSPLVRFTADERRLPLIQAAAEHAGCGLLLDQDGMLQLYAVDVLAFVAFARELLLRREALDAIETSVAIQRPPEYAGDLQAEVRRRDLWRALGATESVFPVQSDAQQPLFDLEQPPDQ